MKARIRWLAAHGVVRYGAKKAAAHGDPQAMLVADPVTRADPRPVFERIRATGPLVKTRIGHISVDHGVVHELLRSDDFRVTQLGANLPAPLRWIENRTRPSSLHPLKPPSLLSVEPPEHTRYRKLVSSVFTPRAVARMREMVQEKADELLDELTHGAREIDIVAQYCSQLPVAVISSILGVPDADRQRVLEFGEMAAPSLDIGLTWEQFVRVEDGLRQFDAWLAGHLAELRQNPGDDLMSQLIRAEDDGVGLNDEELRATAGLVLAAGFETTVNLLGSGVRLLLDHPDQLALLHRDPSLWPSAVEEMLRLESPVQLTARLAKRDVTIEGVPLTQGDLVVLVLAGANRDPDVFDDPYRFDVTRANANKHLSFSGGRHYCLGASLAKAESEVGLKTLFDRFPHLHAAGEGIRRDTRVLHGWASLPVDLGQPAATGAAR
ncbi:cytochrome P450 [Rhodococcus sp. BP-252]|uniref:Cytochrome n=1 Tax=Rhodococcoides kyotonense TaxID=398843 RepID=A0A177YD66_9NOCA|nr:MULTISPECIES: cytochrome P450 [Rhodococcus]MBY6413017.1 cytochrome P450 [Rhodococcus sp. BP-320]MBY6418544.1 cytochrome P450 [Rhodococcus sp. BP-321]MBY6422754.1 cytochrome P450 [Rhodococcus sp. BP-324]MBY6428490.1 cytochrome P450 [Rhodococcus sp. BP-323]MBY6432939.1 cytochrome P450 [Rhodococcus sp. BP-322]